MQVAILEDEPAHAEALRRAVTDLGLQAHVYADGAVLLRELHRARFDALIVDWHVPRVSGPEIVRWVRRHFEVRVPILVVTSRDAEEDVVEGLDSGADDYLTKPFGQAELMARLRALLRRAYPPAQEPADVFGPYRFDTRLRTVHCHGRGIALKPREYDLALYMFRNQARLLAHQELLAELWGVSAIDTRTVATHVSQLRRKLDLRPHNGFRIVPVYGAGYRLEPVTAEEQTA